MKKLLIDGAISVALIITFALVLCVSYATAQQANSIYSSLTPNALDANNVASFPPLPFTAGETFMLPPGNGSFGFYLGGFGGTIGAIFAVPMLPTVGVGAYCGGSIDIPYLSSLFFTLSVLDLSNPGVCQVIPQCQTVRYPFFAGDVIGLSVQAAVFSGQGCGLTLSNAFYLAH